MISESDVSLESVNSDEVLSGEFIEVEFHKKWSGLNIIDK